jgi:hypothetical protein
MLKGRHFNRSVILRFCHGNVDKGEGGPERNVA